MYSADIPATILDYAGLNIPDAFYGISYKDVISGKEIEREYQYLESKIRYQKRKLIAT
jgi:hypothetical protein